MILHADDGTGHPCTYAFDPLPRSARPLGCPVPEPPGFCLKTTHIDMSERGARDHKGGGKTTHRWEGSVTGGGATQPHDNRVDKRELEADRLKEDLEDAPMIK